MAPTSARTDCHRPSTIVPTDYIPLAFYALATQQDGWPIPAFNVDLVIKFQNENTSRMYGCLGRCGVCGTHFVYGELWKHEPSGELLHVGHQCAEKYNLCADWSGEKRKRATFVLAEIAKAERAANRERAEQFISEHDLRSDLDTDHPIIIDIRCKLFDYGELTDKQVALVRKIAKEVRERATEKHVKAPEGRQAFEGIVISAKWHDNDYGGAMKIVVKVQTDNGSWLAWGTSPSVFFNVWETASKAHRDAAFDEYEARTKQVADAIASGQLTGADADAAMQAVSDETAEERAFPGFSDWLKGQTVRLTGTLKRGRDDHFAFFKRPSKAIVVDLDN